MRLNPKFSFSSILGPRGGLLLLAIALMVGSCARFTSPVFEEAYDEISPGSLADSAAFPLPQESAILTIAGKIGQTNQGDRLLLDLPTLERLPMVEYGVMDPFENYPTKFQGIVMRDFLQRLDLDPTATTIRVKALNQYQMEIPIADLLQYPVILALKRDGEYLQPDYQGPLMLVWPYAHYEFSRVATDDWWVWQIASMEVY